MSQFDSPWKEVLDRFLAWFLEFFFPEAHSDIDWSRGYQSLDKELAQIVREAEAGGRLADKLFKVYLKDGEESWVLIHLEAQAQVDDTRLFTERIYTYNYRIYDRFQRPVATFVVLGDQKAEWRPHQFSYNIWGTEVLLKFPIVKLLDYRQRQVELEQHTNPIALIVLAHLQSMATQDDPEQRRAVKVRLAKNLLNRGMDADDIRQLFRVIDWLLDLPHELSQRFWLEIQEYERAMQMPVFTSTEKYLIEVGREQGLEAGRAVGREQGREEGKSNTLLDGISAWLQLKFGAEGDALMADVRNIQDINTLRTLQQELWSAESIAAARTLVQAKQ